MKNFFLFIGILLFLNSCTTGTWKSRDGNNYNLSTDTGYCKSLANSRYPIYICRNPLMCAPDETNKAISSITQNSATFKNCMYKSGYYYEEN